MNSGQRRGLCFILGIGCVIGAIVFLVNVIEVKGNLDFWIATLHDPPTLNDVYILDRLHHEFNFNLILMISFLLPSLGLFFGAIMARND